MSLRRRIKKLLERFTNTHIFRGVLPRGLDVAYDIKIFFPMYIASAVFDVGANIGQSAERYLNDFPRSQIYCFEPVSDTFRELRENLIDNDRVHCFQLALGSSNGKGEMVKEGRSSQFFMVNRAEDPPLHKDLTTEEVETITLEEFCRARSIENISYLKIDTEGWDLEVLLGGENMLKEQRIDFVQVESGMNPENKRHIPFETLKDYMESRRYFLFGIYGQVHEWPTNKANLRRSDLVFVSQNSVEKNI